MPAPEETEPQTVKKAKKGKLKTIIISLVIVVVLIIIGVGGFIAYSALTAEEVPPQTQETAGGTAEPAPMAAKSGEAGIMFDLPAFVVNLADPSGTKYLRVGLSVELPPRDKKLQPELEQKLPKIKDTIITILSSKTLDEITTAQGKISLKQELLRRINSQLSSGRLLDIYITEFVVQ